MSKHVYIFIMIKTPNVAGAFYPADKATIISMLDSFFNNIKIDKEIDNLKAIVAPHAWYIFSWPVAAYSYQTVKDHWKKIPKTFIIMAPSHYEYFEWISVWLFEKFETPLGTLETDRELGKKLINQYPDFFSFVPTAFNQEHSYEVQLPFLQYISKSQIPNSTFKILPLVFGNVNPIQVGDILFELSKKEKIFFIVSSDLSHFMEYSNAVKTDEETLNDFVEKDREKIVNEADACGIHPRLALTEIAIKAKWKPKVLKYLNSWDTAWDKSRVVGYSAVAYYLSL